MRAFAVLAGLGEDYIVGHGDLIGRTSSAAVVIDDPRISEAHAIVSLRRHELHLLSLRRMVIADGKPVSDIKLTKGMRITLVEDIQFTVTQIEAPRAVLALALPSGEVQMLPQVASITTAPVRLHTKLVPDAAASIWFTGDHWTLRIGNTTTQVAPLDEFTLDGQRFAFVLMPIGDASVASTQGEALVAAPIKLVAYYDSVQIYQRNQKVHTVGGTGARIISELIGCQGPTHWEVIAREIWPDEVEALPLRHRWDVSLGRLRTRLRNAGVRDLLRADGTGQLALEMYPGDEIEDKT